MKKDKNYEGMVYNYYISNIIWKKDGYESCINIMKEFLEDELIIFSFYRKDGLNYKVTDTTPEELENYIDTNGLIITEPEYGHCHCGYLTNTKETWNLIPDISRKHLESIFFSTNKKFETFKDLYFKDTMKRCSFYINEGFTDIIFAFVDSGDFCIFFNTKKIPVTYIEELVSKNNLQEDE